MRYLKNKGKITLFSTERYRIINIFKQNKDRREGNNAATKLTN